VTKWTFSISSSPFGRRFFLSMTPRFGVMDTKPSSPMRTKHLTLENVAKHKPRPSSPTAVCLIVATFHYTQRAADLSNTSRILLQLTRISIWKGNSGSTAGLRSSIWNVLSVLREAGDFASHSLHAGVLYPFALSGQTLSVSFSAHVYPLCRGKPGKITFWLGKHTKTV